MFGVTLAREFSLGGRGVEEQERADPLSPSCPPLSTRLLRTLYEKMAGAPPAGPPKLTNLYHLRTVGTPKPCVICSKETVACLCTLSSKRSSYES